jgi:hypothetical protein
MGYSVERELLHVEQTQTPVIELVVEATRSIHAKMCKNRPRSKMGRNINQELRIWKHS